MLYEMALNNEIVKLRAELATANAQLLQKAELEVKVLEALGVDDAVLMHGQDPVEAAKAIIDHTCNAEVDLATLRAENARLVTENARLIGKLEDIHASHSVWALSDNGQFAAEALEQIGEHVERALTPPASK